MVFVFILLFASRSQIITSTLSIFIHLYYLYHTAIFKLAIFYSTMFCSQKNSTTKKTQYYALITEVKCSFTDMK